MRRALKLYADAKDVPDPDGELFAIDSTLIDSSLANFHTSWDTTQKNWLLVTSFIIFKGTLKLASDVDGFTEGATYAYVCVAAEKDLMRALEDANGKAKKGGFIIETVDGSPMRVPAWRSFLPTSQGRALREARQLGAIITVCSEVTGAGSVVGEERG